MPAPLSALSLQTVGAICCTRRRRAHPSPLSPAAMQAPLTPRTSSSLLGERRRRRYAAPLRRRRDKTPPARQTYESTLIPLPSLAFRLQARTCCQRRVSAWARHDDTTAFSFRRSLLAVTPYHRDSASLWKNPPVSPPSARSFIWVSTNSVRAPSSGVRWPRCDVMSVSQ